MLAEWLTCAQVTRLTVVSRLPPREGRRAGWARFWPLLLYDSRLFPSLDLSVPIYLMQREAGLGASCLIQVKRMWLLAPDGLELGIRRCCVLGWP